MKTRKYKPDQGFTLIEVVVGIVMVLFFTLTALQMLVLSGLFKKKATQYTTAISLIQQDVEKIKSAADNYSFPTVSGSGATVGATSIPLTTPVNGLTPGNTIQFSNHSNTYTISTVTSNSITIGSGLTVAIPSPTPSPSPTNAITVINNTVCTKTTFTPTPSPSTTSVPGSMANLLQDNLSTLATGIGNTAYSVNKVSGSYYAVTGTPTQKNGAYYWLLRNQTIAVKPTTTPTPAPSPTPILPDAPYNVLQIRYVVQPGSNSSPSTSPNTTATPLAQYYTEVIPYASLQCPSE